MREARGRAEKDYTIRGRHGDPKAKSEGGILNLSLPLRCDLLMSHTPSEFPLTG